MAFTTRPVFYGTRGVVTAGHYLAAAAGFKIMLQGGNAIDAAAATCFCLNLLEPQNNGIGGEAPTLIYSSAERKAFQISGQGWSPAAFTIDWCRGHGIDLIPGDGYLPACVPATVGLWSAALVRFGTLSFSQILAPAIELAEDGFPIYEGLHASLNKNAAKFQEHYPTTAALYLPNGKAPAIGQVWRNPDWAAVLKRMCAAEQAAAGVSRIAGIEAAQAEFYRGETAARIVDFIRTHPVIDATGQAHTGLLSLSDMAEWQPEITESASMDYRGVTVHKCGPWTQGPVFLQQLALLEGYDLKAMGHNSAEYLHTVIECAKLAFADREAYYGDPNFDSVPLDVLLSKPYAEARRGLIGPTASGEMRPGDVGRGHPAYAASFDVAADNRFGMHATGVGNSAYRPYKIKHTHLGDTTHCDAVDRAGNMVACTPSGGWIGTSPVIQGLGFPLGTRGQMYYLNPGRPNALEPRKRPRATLTPTLVTTRDGDPLMAFGTPGGDGQDQWTLQFLLNRLEFGMTLQEAIDAPTVDSLHFPSSFYPRDAYPNRMEAEDRIPAEVIADLRARGHEIDVTEGWVNGKVLGIEVDAAHGSIAGAASPRHQIAYVMGW